MAQTVDMLGKMDWNEDAHELMSVYSKREAKSVSNFQIFKIDLTSNRTDVEVALSTNFTTATYGYIKETGGNSFTYSRDQTTHQHLVNANGFVMWEGDTTHLYLNNNNQGVANIGTAVLTIVLAG